MIPVKQEVVPLETNQIPSVAAINASPNHAARTSPSVLCSPAAAATAEPPARSRAIGHERAFLYPSLSCAGSRSFSYSTVAAPQRKPQLHE